MTDKVNPWCLAEVRVVGFDGPDLACEMTVDSPERGNLGTLQFRVAVEAASQLPNIIVGLLGDAAMNPVGELKFEDGKYSISVFDVNTLRKDG